MTRLTPRLAAASAAIPLLATLAGCHAAPPAPAHASAPPNLGPPMTDVRTETAIQEMENRYQADKNSQPTHQWEVEAERKKKEAEALKKKQEAEAAAAKAAADQKPAENPGVNH